MLAVLSQLAEAQYGYNLIQALAAKGFDVEEGTLYPLLRRLEQQGLLESKWEVGENRPRKYYLISPMGQAVLATLSAEWFETVGMMQTILKNGDQS